MSPCDIAPLERHINDNSENHLSNSTGTHLLKGCKPSLATRCNATAIALHGDWSELIADLAYVGELKIRTESEHASFECKSCYRTSSCNNCGKCDRGGLGNSTISTDTKQWAECYVVREKSLHGTQHRLRIFDQNNRELHSVTMQEESDHDAWQALIELYSYPLSKSDTESMRTGLNARETEAAENVLAWLRLSEVRQSDFLMPFHGFNQMVSASLIGYDALIELLSYLATDKLPVNVAIANTSVAHECQVIFDRIHWSENFIRLKNRTCSLQMKLPSSATYWIVSGSLNGQPSNSIELHDPVGSLIARLSTGTDDFCWNNFLYAAMAK